MTNILVYNRPPLGFVQRITEVPILAPDGRLIAKEGFDAASGIYYLPSPDLAELEINSEPPSRTEIEIALALIDDLTGDFPFVAGCDRAHAIAFMLLPIVRLTIPGRTPLFRFEAPQPRTGKTLLARVGMRLTCLNISDVSPTRDEEEWRKRITTVLREEPEGVLIDNAASLDSAQLAKLLTDDIWQDRQLGGNETVRYPVRCTLAATLNNPIISREILGRSLRIRLDAKTDRPEQRAKFRHPNLEEYARENRAKLVGALLTLARSASGFDAKAPVLGGYEAFSRRMAAILRSIGVTGFLGDRADDSALSADEAALVVFVEAWAKQFSTREVILAHLLPVAENVDGLSLGRSDNERSKRTALGIFLRAHRGYTVSGWQISDPQANEHPPGASSQRRTSKRRPVQTIWPSKRRDTTSNLRADLADLCRPFSILQERADS